MNKLLDTAVEAARLAGRTALEMIGSAKTSIKNNSELVTEADKRCQQRVIEMVHSRFPDHGFIGEEGEAGRLFKEPPRSAADPWWIIDPIDGTNNFAFGLPQFSVSLGVMQHGRPIAGVIYDPSTDRLYTASDRQGPEENGAPIQTSDQDLNPYGCVGLDSHFGPTIPPWICRVMVLGRFRNIGTTALHLAYVAKGGYVASILSTPKLWDIAAGTLIAERAGAVVTDWKGQSLWPVDLEAYRGEPLCAVVGSERAHARIMGLMAQFP